MIAILVDDVQRAIAPCLIVVRSLDCVRLVYMCLYVSVCVFAQQDRSPV